MAPHIIQIRSLLIGSILLFALNARAAEEETGPADRRLKVSIGSGIDFSQGDYGENLDTRAASLSVFTKWEWEPITFRASVPFSVIDGSDRIRGGADGAEFADGGAGNDRIDYGLGDVTTSLTYTYYPDAEQRILPIVDLTTKVKIPTATNGLGTGETDVTLQFELSKVLWRFSPFIGSGFRFRGGGDFEDTWLFFAGTGFRVTKGFSVGVAYDFREAATDFAQNASEISPYLAFRFGEHVRLTPYGVIGLTDGAPDWGVGSTISYQF